MIMDLRISKKLGHCHVSYVTLTSAYSELRGDQRYLNIKHIIHSFSIIILLKLLYN